MARQQPRQFPTTRFKVISSGQKLEEERLPFNVRDEYFSMQIGEVVHTHYQVVAHNIARLYASVPARGKVARPC